MNELDVIREARPPEDYPDDRRAAARARLLAEMTGHRAGPPSCSRTRRISWRWQAGLAAALALGAGAAVIAPHVTRAPPPAHSPRPAPASNARHLLELAARTADAAVPPAGTRWIVTMIRDTSTGWSVPRCMMVAKGTTGLTYAKMSLSVTGACAATPPGSLPELRTLRKITAWPASAGYPPGLPDAPRPLLAGLYHWLSSRPADSLPGKPAPSVSKADLFGEAFDTLSLMINDGVTRPSPGVLLEAMGMIPGVKVVRLAHDVLGRPGIAVTTSSHGDRHTIIIDPATYKIIGGSDTYPLWGGHSVTMTDAQLWRAYYDAAGHRL